jgi:hypothetical protein
MSSVPKDVQLVDLDGRPIPAPAEAWPAWTDATRWVPTEPAEDLPAEDQAEEWDFPPRRQVSPIELSMLAAHGAI